MLYPQYRGPLQHGTFLSKLGLHQEIIIVPWRNHRISGRSKFSETTDCHDKKHKISRAADNEKQQNLRESQSTYTTTAGERPYTWNLGFTRAEGIPQISAKPSTQPIATYTSLHTRDQDRETNGI